MPGVGGSFCLSLRQHILPPGLGLAGEATALSPWGTLLGGPQGQSSFLPHVRDSYFHRSSEGPAWGSPAALCQVNKHFLGARAQPDRGHGEADVQCVCSRAHVCRYMGVNVCACVTASVHVCVQTHVYTCVHV